MRTSRMLGAIAALMTVAGVDAGVGAGGADAAPRRAPETIAYTTEPCFGACPVYQVTVSADGRGSFWGQRFTAVKGRHRFRVTPAQWAAFRDRLAPLHGHGTVELTGPPACKVMVTDQPGVEVVWSGSRPFTLRANYGCRTDGQDWMFARLRHAPDALPIARFIGRR